MSGKKPMEFKEIRKKCPTCDYGWLDKYGKNECPKCLTPLTGLKLGRAPGESTANKFWSPSDAFESEFGSCPQGDSHTFKFGKCSKCGKGEGYVKHGTGKDKEFKEVKRSCPTCSYTWLDKYRKNECPKCLYALEDWRNDRPDAPKPSDAFESESGDCPSGGAHTWKYGYCLKCKAGEGHARNNVQVEWLKRSCPTCTYSWNDRYRKNQCPKCLRPIEVEEKKVTRTTYITATIEWGSCNEGGAHVFKFGKCRKCHLAEGTAGYVGQA
eukprot:jgi/Tetstr1/453861/TSEL_040783.t1